MAISASSVWEVRSNASAGNVGGGFFVTGASGTDYSRQAAPQYALTGVTSAGAGNTILTASAAADMVGNGLRVISGTNFTTDNPWFEITSVSVGVSITCSTNKAGASICTGVGSSGVVNIGGAISLQDTSDQTFFNAGSAGNTVWIKQGTYTMGASILTSVTGTTALPFVIRGYNTTRGDNPTTRATMPKLIGALYFGSAFQYLRNLYMRAPGAGNNGIDLGGIMYQCIIENADTNANNAAIFCAGHVALIDCEIICYRGRGVVPNTGSVVINGCYIHHCDVGLSLNGTAAGVSITNSIIEGCVTAGIRFLNAQVAAHIISGNTFYGAATKLGNAVQYDNGSAAMQIITNNIFYGFATAISCNSAKVLNYVNSNTFFNNTADVSNITKGALDIALDPGFTSVAEYTGTTATTAGGVMTDSGANFANVVDGRDFIYFISGTGVTAGIYGISSHTSTTITPDIAPGNNATADKVYKIIYGHNFASGTSMKAVGTPSSFPGGLTTSYIDIGAAQRAESSGGGGRSNNHLGMGRLG